MTELLTLVVLMAVFARASGGGIVRLPELLKSVPEGIFAIPFGLAALLQYGALAGVAGALWSYIWMQTGHGNALHMGRYPLVALSGRKHFLSPVVDPVCRWLGQPLGGVFYCWLLFGLKGLMIGLPCGVYGPLLALLWPLSYEIGHRIKPGSSLYGEFLTGASSGVVIWLTIFAG